MSHFILSVLERNHNASWQWHVRIKTPLFPLPPSITFPPPPPPVVRKGTSRSTSRSSLGTHCGSPWGCGGQVVVGVGGEERTRLTHKITVFLDRERAAHSSVLAWEIPQTENVQSYSPWGPREYHTTSWLNNNNILTFTKSLHLYHLMQISPRAPWGAGTKAGHQFLKELRGD